MFFVNHNGDSLLIKPYLSSGMSLDKGEIQILELVSQFTVVGKSSCFDNFYTHYANLYTITFTGNKFFEFPEDMSIELFQLTNDAGFILHNKKKGLAFASRSLSLLNDYMYAYGQSLISLFKEAERTTIIEPFFINDNFNISDITPSPEEHLIFDLSWDEDSFNHFPFKVIINKDTYRKEEGMFVNKYSGNVLGVGAFEQYIVKGQNDPDMTYPEFFPERELNYSVIFNNLVNDNAEQILLPNIMLENEYHAMIKDAKLNGKDTLVFSGLSKYGYTILAHIKILPESESTTGYEAKIEKLILSPAPKLDANFVFRD